MFGMMLNALSKHVVKLPASTATSNPEALRGKLVDMTTLRARRRGVFFMEPPACEWRLGCGRGDITGPAAEIGFFGMAKDTQARPVHSFKFAHSAISLLHFTNFTVIMLAGRSQRAFS